MSYTLDEFAGDIRTALKDGTSDDSLENVRLCVEKALKDDALVAQYVPEDQEEERVVLFEDPELKFCICAHNYKGPKDGNPHDHGPTWAIYGQAVGQTTMTDWEIVKPAAGDEPALVKKSKSYTMTPGDAHVYPVGAVHAPYREGPTRLIRIEGEDTMGLTRTKIEIAEGVDA